MRIDRVGGLLQSNTQPRSVPGKAAEPFRVNSPEAPQLPGGSPAVQSRAALPRRGIELMTDHLVTGGPLPELPPTRAGGTASLAPAPATGRAVRGHPLANTGTPVDLADRLRRQRLQLSRLLGEIAREADQMGSG